MAYTDDAVKAKLSSLNDTQDSIVTVAQWIMFHRRNATRTAQLWMQRLKESGSAKRLNLIYLANGSRYLLSTLFEKLTVGGAEVVQQSKARRKDDFLVAFSPMIADATGWAYKGASAEVQHRLRRVVEVWRQRNIFDPSVQDTVETRIDGLDKDRSASGKRPLGGTLFSSTSSAPSEIQLLSALQTTLSKASLAVHSSAASATAEYTTLTDESQAAPAPPVHAARLSAALKLLATAEGAVSESIKARQALIGELENLLKSNRETLAAEETQSQQLSVQRAEIETKKRAVEDSIMQGLSADDAANGSAFAEDSALADGPDAERPDFEALTPPPVESFTPPEDPPEDLLGSVTDSTDRVAQADQFLQSIPLQHEPSITPQPKASMISPAALEDHRGTQRSSNGSPTNGTAGFGSNKKRKMSHGVGEEDIPAFGPGEDAMADLDDDVKGLLES